MKRSEVQAADLLQLVTLAADVGSNVVVQTDATGDSTFTVDAITFDNVHTAIKHLEAVL